MKKKWVSLLVAVCIIVIAFGVIFLRGAPSGDVTPELAQCIGQNSLIYVQIGCHYCEMQEAMFGENVKSLNMVVCNTDPSKCAGLTGTPIWEINGQQYPGLKSIEDLKTLTGC